LDKAQRNTVNEAEWNACTDPDALLGFLRERISRRKVRLFAVACCRRIWHLLEDDRSRHAVLTSERYADGLVRRKELAESRKGALAIVADSVGTPAAFAATSAARPVVAPAWVALLARHAVAGGEGVPRGPDKERTAQAVILRDVIGNPFRPAPAVPATLLTRNGGCLVSLAQSLYEERRFEDLPVLADALEEAGCTDPDILSHLRGPGPHVRGCWVLDILLGKS
jgi:hypothetical protein